jgi:hypothetical protein
VKADRFRDFGKLLMLVAALRVVAALMTPAGDGDTAFDQLLASTILLIGHGFVYTFGAKMRAAKGDIPYLVIQATLAMSIGLFSLSLWLAIVLFSSLGAQAYVLLRHRKAAVLVVTMATMGYAVSVSLGWSPYRGVATALMLASIAAVISTLTFRSKRR